MNPEEEKGEFDMTPLRVLLVAVALVIFAGAAISAAPAEKPKNIVVTGTLQQVEGPECTVIMLEGYHLVGNLQGFGPGDTVTVTGAADIQTFCQMGTPLRVISITGS